MKAETSLNVELQWGGKTETDIILSHTVEPQNPTFPKDQNKCLHIKNIAK